MPNYNYVARKLNLTFRPRGSSDTIVLPANSSVMVEYLDQKAPEKWLGNYRRRRRRQSDTDTETPTGTTTAAILNDF